MIQNKIQLEIKKGERSYQLNISPDSPLGELYDVLSEMRGYVYTRLKEVEEASKAQDEKPLETIEPVKE